MNTEARDTERAAYFQTMTSMVIRTSAVALKDSNEKLKEALSNISSQKNTLGEDIDPSTILEIQRLLENGLQPATAYREAQLRELAFWRWVAYEGYQDVPPVLFPLMQQHFMVSTFYRTPWTLQVFRDASILELGCGPLGMIEYIPGRDRVTFDPLNDYYGRLFSMCRDKNIKHLHDEADLVALPSKFDLAICHNVIDHTENPEWWFNMLFSKLKFGGNFIFQVNLSRPGIPQKMEHRKMHPSPISREQVLSWISAISDDFDFYESNEKSADGEFYFLCWGRKTVRDPSPVSYSPWETDNSLDLL
jgi:SAM-dependent methyltransferase